MPTVQKNFRLDQYYAGMLAWFSERFGASEAEILRRGLRFINYRYGMVLRLAERFIGALRDRYGEDARIELRLSEKYGVTADVYVDGEHDKELIGHVGVGTFEERSRGGRERWRLYLAPAPGSRYEPVPIPDLHADLYIGLIDPASPAAVSIRVGDLVPEMQEFWGLVGTPDDEELPREALTVWYGPLTDASEEEPAPPIEIDDPV